MKFYIEEKNKNFFYQVQWFWKKLKVLKTLLMVIQKIFFLKSA
jgi:hypothetical protein